MRLYRCFSSNICCGSSSEIAAGEGLSGFVTQAAALPTRQENREDAFVCDGGMNS